MNRNIAFAKKDTAEVVEKQMSEPKAGEVRVRLVRSCISSVAEAWFAILLFGILRAVLEKGLRPCAESRVDADL